MADVYEIFIYQNGSLVGGGTFSQVHSCDVTTDPAYAAKLYDYPITWLGQNRTYNQIAVHKNGRNWAAFMVGTAAQVYVQVDGAGAGKDLIDVYVQQQSVGKPLFVPNLANAGPAASVSQPYSGPTWDIKAYGVVGVIGEITQGSDGTVDLTPADKTVAWFLNWTFYPTQTCMIDYILIKRDGQLWAKIDLPLASRSRKTPLAYWMTTLGYNLTVSSEHLVTTVGSGVLQGTCDCGAAASDYTISRLGGTGHSDWCKVANKP